MAYQQERKYYTSLLALLAAKNTTTWKRTAPTKIMACLCAGPNRFSHIPPLPVVWKLIKIRCLVIWFWLTAKPPLHCPGLGKLVSPSCLPWCSLQKSRGTCRSESAHRLRPREGWDQGMLWRSAYLQTRHVHSKRTGILSKTYCSSPMSTYIYRCFKLQPISPLVSFPTSTTQTLKSPSRCNSLSTTFFNTLKLASYAQRRSGWWVVGG